MSISKTLYYLFIALLVVVGTTLIISLLPLKGNIKLLTVLSGSMEPTIKTGSVVLIKPITTYKVGDVITFGEMTQTTVPKTHRIVSTEIINGTQYYATKGDANKDEDISKVKIDDVRGKVLFWIPYMGYGVNFIQTKRGFLLLIIIPCILIIISEVSKVIKNLKNESKIHEQDNQ